MEAAKLSYVWLLPLLERRAAFTLRIWTRMAGPGVVTMKRPRLVLAVAGVRGRVGRAII